ncbi:taperin isoform X2 [Elgaria multicarinata webbii]|uniref:taperin isoform X2 n=1 Tax=Elgaria multicarinata webbii TaxID=159646 RepID=UPI002FCD41F5
MSSPPLGPGAAAAGLPAWKRAILERKRAKLAAGVELGRAPEAARPKGEAAPRQGPGERLVVAESLGPLRENPFMRQESERRRRRRRRVPPPPPPPPPPHGPAACAAAAPSSPAPEPPALTQLLELYSSMPGIRTIRADNILIIESQAASGAPGPPRQVSPVVSPASPSPRSRDPFRELLSRGGSAVTEIRAAEVVIYEPSPARPGSAPSGAGFQLASEPGRVSRLLQKFDRRPRGGNVARAKWWGGEGPRLGPGVPNACLEDEAVPAPPPAVPTGAVRPSSPCSPQPGTRHFVQKIGSNSFTVNPRGYRPPGPAIPGHVAGPMLSNGPVALEEDAVAMLAVPKGRSQCVAAPAGLKPVPSPSTAAASSPIRANSWKPKPEGAVETPPLPSSASQDSCATAGSPRLTPLSSSSCSFEIHPAPKPDLAAIPAHDVQAQALASLRLNSRNSFLFVPRQRGEVPGPPEPSETLPTLPGGGLPAGPEKPAETLVPVTYIDEDLVELESDHLPPLKVLSPRLEGFDVPQENNLVHDMEDSAVLSYRPHPAGFATVSQKGSNTITIVPKRKPPSAGLETFSRAWLQEEEEEEEESQAKARSDTPHQDLGQLLKKRYPTVNEIEVIGGYLSLDKSCMSKSGSRRKKMKISFNESSLQTMFEYPSESSLVEEEEKEEEEEYATEVDETPALFIPRPSSTLHSNGTDSGLSGYTPKHSVEFSKWQEQQYEEMPPSTGAFPQDADPPGNQVMLTPADKSSLSDFSSEPALYF